MLTGRYVHLHQALGLGAMWLKQEARVVVNKPVLPAVSAPVVKKLPSPSAHSAREALLQRFVKPAESEVVPSVAVNVAPLTHQDHLNELKGKIQPARVMVLCECPSTDEIMAGGLLQGETGELLRKMFEAIGVRLDDVRFSSWFDVPQFNGWSLAQIREAGERLRVEHELSGAQALLLLGNFFERDEVLQEVRSWSGGKPFFAIPHPRQILDHPQINKRVAWEALKQLKAVLVS